MEIEKKLEREGSVAKVEKEKVRSFDIALASEKAYLIKIIGNAESFSKEQAESLRKSAAVVGAKPIVICEKAREEIKEGIVYTRHGIPVMRQKTFIKYLRGEKVYIADRGGIKVPVSNIRKEREKRGISRGALARMLGVSREMIKKYEEGKAYPSEDVAKKMVKIFGSGIIKRVEFEVAKIKKAYIGKAPFEIGIRKRKPVLVSLKDDEQRIRNLEKVSEVLDAKMIVAKNLEDII